MKKEKFLEIINDILANKSIQNLKLYKHHYAYTRLEHCLSVSYYTYVICKFLHLDYKSAARAALLHDLFFYDCEDKISRPKNHIKNHPNIALENANKLFNLNKKEQDIILKHMWPLTVVPPKCREAYVICYFDKTCTLKEVFKEWGVSLRKLMARGLVKK